MDIHAQGLGEGVQKRTAAGGTGFIEKNIIDSTVFDTAALHILSTDIQNGGDFREEMESTAVMGNCFHLTGISFQCLADQILAVTGRSGGTNVSTGR